MTIQQKTLSRLLSEQDRFDDRRLSASFVEMAGELPCRPHPRALFDNAASPGRVEYYGMRLVIGADACLDGAAMCRNERLFEQTGLRIKKHLSALSDRMLKKYTRVASGEHSLDEAADAAARETANLSASLTHWAIRHDEAARDETVRAIDTEIARLAMLREAFFAPAVPLNQRPALVRA